MHSIYQRLNVASTLLSTCLFVLLGSIALTSYLHQTTPGGTLFVDSLKIKIGRSRYSSIAQQNAIVNFDFDADLTPLSHWNTKQVFLYLSAEYTNRQGTENEVVFWDKIVRRRQDAQIHIQGRNKYIFKDIDKNFANSSAVRFSMKYNVMPWVGPLLYGVAGKSEDRVFPKPESKV